MVSVPDEFFSALKETVLHQNRFANIRMAGLDQVKQFQFIPILCGDPVTFNLDGWINVLNKLPKFLVLLI